MMKNKARSVLHFTTACCVVVTQRQLPGSWSRSSFYKFVTQFGDLAAHEHAGDNGKFAAKLLDMGMVVAVTQLVVIKRMCTYSSLRVYS